jgi:hypothetical protein
MKPDHSRRPFSPKGICAFTLVEMMISLGIFSMVTVAMVYAHVIGMRQDELVQSKCGASASSRRGFDQLARDIRGAKRWQVGNQSGSTFTPIVGLQRGNAVKVSLTHDTNKFITYFFDTSNPNDSVLFRFHSGDPASTIVASNLYNSGMFSNSLCFSSEGYDGSPRTDVLSFRYMIHSILELRQFQYPTTTVGTNSLYDYYKLEFKLTPHLPD